MSLRSAKRWGKRWLGRGLPWRVAARVARPAGISVLTYHRITSADSIYEGRQIEEFRAQMAWLADHCHPIGIESFSDNLKEARRTGRPPVLVTFDDGYRDFYTSAFPILQKLSIPAVLFLSTRMIDDGSMIWPDEVTRMLHGASLRRFVLPWDCGQIVSIETPGERRAAEYRCKSFLKAVDEHERVQYVARLREALEFGDASEPQERSMLTWDEVRKVMGHTTIGAHGHDHFILSRLSDAEAESQIVKSASRIHQETGKKPRYFAYPNGQPGDYSETTKQLVRKHGFELAFSCMPGVHTRSDDLYEIRRQATGARDLGDFAALVYGVDGL